MSPLPDRHRLSEYGLKGVHLGLRQVAMAPEQVRGRRLAAQARVQSPTPSGPRVLFLTPRDWAVHVQWESVMAQALRLRGADVRFLTCGGDLRLCDRVNMYEGPPPPCGTCRRYVEGSIEAHGFAHRSLHDGWAGGPLDGDAWPELDGLSLDELFAVVDDGLPLGALLQIPVRWFLLKSAIEDEPLAPVTARRFLRSARRVVAGLRAALSANRPDVVVVLNGLFFFESIALALCRSMGIRTVFYERGFIPGTVLMHDSHPDLLLDVSEEWVTARDRPLTAEQEATLDAYVEDRRLGRRTMDQYWARGTRYGLELAPNEGRTVVLFTNLTWDSAVLGQELAFSGIHDWLVTSIDWFLAHPEHRLFVRVHPAEVKLAGKQTREPLADFVRARFPDLPPNVELIEPSNPVSSYTLMAAADAGLVYTTTAGLELALAGKPVIVAGRTHYAGKGFTIDVESKAAFTRALEALLRDPAAATPDADLVRRYAYLFFFDAPLTIPGVEEHVPGLARLSIEHLDELAPGKHKDVDRICELILGARTAQISRRADV
jgi:hypothetical protein